MLVPYLQGDLVELCEGEDSLLHHVDALVPQQHVQVGHQTQQQLVVTFTGEEAEQHWTNHEAELINIRKYSCRQLTNH